MQCPRDLGYLLIYLFLQGTISLGRNLKFDLHPVVHPLGVRGYSSAKLASNQKLSIVWIQTQSAVPVPP